LEIQVLQEQLALVKLAQQALLVIQEQLELLEIPV
jgi:hypothetical protein